jgi:PAS domain S-box-containing protein
MTTKPRPQPTVLSSEAAQALPRVNHERIPQAIGQREALLRTGALQRAIFNSANFSSIATDAKGVIQIFNVGAERLLGYTAAEVVNKITPADLHDPEEVIARAAALSLEFGTPIAPGFEALVFKAARGIEDIYELTKVRKDGSRIPAVVSVTALRDAQDAIIGYLLIGTENTARKKAKEERNRFFALSRDMLCTLGFDGYYKDLNPAWENTLGYTRAELLAAPFIEFVHPDDQQVTLAEAEKIAAGNPLIAFENRYRCKDGSYRSFLWNATAVVEDQVIYGSARDITDRKHAEEEQRNLAEASEHIRQDQMRFKDEFLSHVSHELRSPLTAIKQFTTILLGGLAGELNKEQREYQQIVLRNIRQLQSMIDDLLEVTRLETGKFTVEPERVSVAIAVTDTFNTLRGTAHSKGVRLSYDLPPNLPSAYADPTRLRQILIILLDNAIKFTPDGGSVTIHARLLQKDPRFLVVEVSDTGCGIGADTGERIFERLYQVSERTETSRKGLGLGLHICKELVLRQGGRIWAERRPQNGSTFSFTLPAFSLDASSTVQLLKNGTRPAHPASMDSIETSSATHFEQAIKSHIIPAAAYHE